MSEGYHIVDASISIVSDAAPELPIGVDSAGREETYRRAAEYVRRSKSAATVRAYGSDWRDFLSWCAPRERSPLPATAETVALYLTDLAESCKLSTLRRRLCSISQAHQAARIDTPTAAYAVRAVLSGIARVHGSAQEGKAAAVTEDLRAMLGTVPKSGLRGLRDRALLLLGFAGAFRRSELVALDVRDLDWKRDGLAVTIRRSKTDQEGQGALKGIPYGQHEGTCPVRALKAWLKASGIEDGPVFRGVNRHGQLQGRLAGNAVAVIVKRCAEAAGLEAARYAGHSLRAGLATSAAAAGVSERAIMAQTGHRSTATVRRYIRSGSLFLDNAAGKVGL